MCYIQWPCRRISNGILNPPRILRGCISLLANHETNLTLTPPYQCFIVMVNHRHIHAWRAQLSSCSLTFFKEKRRRALLLLSIAAAIVHRRTWGDSKGRLILLSCSQIYDPLFLAWTTSLRPESVYVHIGVVVPHCVIMVVNWCSLATDGVLAYVPYPPTPLARPSSISRLRWMLQPGWHFCFLLFFFIFCRRQNSSMKWIIISETSNCKTTNELTFFWLFKGKPFCLIKLAPVCSGRVFFFYFKRTKNSVKL